MVGPRIGICTTNYNCGHALRRHLDSIYSNFEASDFDYVCVDNHSTDGSMTILSEQESLHSNFRWVQRRCSMGAGRELASRLSSAPHILIVDTDTVYFPILRKFVDRVLLEHEDVAVQAIYAGVFPRNLWVQVGGRRDLNVGEDLDMWMRIWKTGRMRWYPLPMGENLKERNSRDGLDYFSERYSKGERLVRFVRGQIDEVKVSPYRRLDLEGIWQSNSVDLRLGETRDSWFSSHPRGSLVDWLLASGRSVLRILEG